jgi:hypothetical protein
MPDSPARVPSMVCHYAAYLRARAHVTPEISVDGNRAEVRLGVGDKVLVAIFGCRKKNWSLRSVEVRRGERATTFTRGELAKAVAALLGHKPLAPAPLAVNGASGPRAGAPPDAGAQQPDAGTGHRRVLLAHLRAELAGLGVRASPQAGERSLGIWPGLYAGLSQDGDRYGWPAEGGIRTHPCRTPPENPPPAPQNPRQPHRHHSTALARDSTSPAAAHAATATPDTKHEEQNLLPRQATPGRKPPQTGITRHTAASLRHPQNVRPRYHNQPRPKREQGPHANVKTSEEWGARGSNPEPTD